MTCRFPFFAACAALAVLCSHGPAEEPAALAEELRALRQLVEIQSKQIAALTRQVEKLSAAVEGKVAPKVDAPKAEPEAEPAPEPAAPADDGTGNAPKADLAGAQKHLVQKGETLTSIAKHYNIPLADLQKANKDLNPAKMQIGQAINIPPAKSPEPAPDKK